MNDHGFQRAGVQASFNSSIHTRTYTYCILFISQREAASEFCPASHSVNRRIVSFSLKMRKISAAWDYFDETDNREKIRCKIGNCKEVLIVGESRSTYNPDPDPDRDRPNPDPDPDPEKK